MANKTELVARREEIKAAIARAALADNVANEGADGYSTADAMQEAHMAELKAIDDALFLLEWTPDVIAARKTLWNDAIRAAGAKVSMSDLAEIEKRLGFTRDDVARVKALTA